MKHAPVFAAVADDDTGATDLAGMLADQGLRTVLLIDLPEPGDYARWTANQDAVIAGTGTRALPPAEAYARTRAAVRLLNSAAPLLLEIKYCSTFDSTREGNIGPSLDAALDELEESFTIALPALPVNGRTTYLGHHFVHGQLLSESPMRHHPLTPMTDPNLVRHLQAQTRRKVGLAPLPKVRAGKDALAAEFARLRAEGVAIAVVDCTTHEDLAPICEALADLRLISGSSAPGIGLPQVWRRRGILSRVAGPVDGARDADPAAGFLIVAGSCSEATRRQNARAEAQGARVYRLDAEAALGETGDWDRTAEQVACDLRTGRTCLVQTSSDPESVRGVQASAAARGLSSAEAGLKIARALAAVVQDIFRRAQPGGLLVAGGETASAICRTLEFGALQVGRNIEPGVPLCHSLGAFRIPVVLKSGNFGSEDFYRRARAAVFG